jgi:hypothetical protein
MADNVASSPQLVPPTIPASYCPTGTTGEVFNNLFQIWVPQILVNLPGIEDLNPATIAEIQAQIAIMQNQIALLQKYSRNGEGLLNNGDSTVPVTFATPVSDNLYNVTILPISDSGAETDPFSWAILANSKTTAGFSVRFVDIPSTVQAFYWSILQQ